MKNLKLRKNKMLSIKIIEENKVLVKIFEQKIIDNLAYFNNLLMNYFLWYNSEKIHLSLDKKHH